MDRRRYPAVGLADELALQDRVAGWTTGRGVPPMLWCSGTASRAGSGAAAIGRVVDCALLVGGLTPP